VEVHLLSVADLKTVYISCHEKMSEISELYLIFSKTSSDVTSGNLIEIAFIFLSILEFKKSASSLPIFPYFYKFSTSVY